MKDKIIGIIKSVSVSVCLFLAFMFFVNRVANLVLVKNPNTPNYKVSENK